MSISWRTNLSLFIVIAIGCSKSPEPKLPEAVAEAQALAKAISGSDKPSPICAMFTPAEIELMLGMPVKPGETAGPLGTGCQWNASTGEGGFLQISVIDELKMWAKQSLSPGYEHLPGVAKDAFVVPELNGYVAQALTDDHIVAIAMTGGSTSRDAAVGALKTVLERLQKKPK